MADMGSLQRLPYIVGHGTAAELALTARTFDAAEAKQLRLVSQVRGCRVMLSTKCFLRGVSAGTAGIRQGQSGLVSQVGVGLRCMTVGSCRRWAGSTGQSQVGECQPVLYERAGCGYRAVAKWAGVAGEWASACAT